MILETVLSAVNENPKYLTFVPFFINSWKKLFPKIQIKIILIMDKIPEEYLLYQDYFILFPTFKNIKTSFISQIIRIFYPALLNNENGIIITDIDMIPLNQSYYQDNIKEIDNDSFISYRSNNLEGKEIVICYNIASSKTWSEIFSIKNIDDIKKLLEEIYFNNFYSGTHGGKGWNLDQQTLYRFVSQWNLKTKKWVVLNPINFLRLDREIFKRYNEKLLVDEKYSDFHAFIPFHENKTLNLNIFDKLKDNRKKLIILVIASVKENYNQFVTNFWIPFIKYSKIYFKNVKIFLIYNNSNIPEDIISEIPENIWKFNYEESFKNIIFKTLDAFQKIFNNNIEFDFILRTNLSSFWNISKFLELLETLPSNNLYYGIIGKKPFTFVSGAGILLSPDNVIKLLENKSNLIGKIMDDLEIAQVLSNPIDGSRKDIVIKNYLQDYSNLDQYLDAYHIRLKNFDRKIDSEIFKILATKFYPIS